MLLLAFAGIVFQSDSPASPVNDIPLIDGIGRYRRHTKVSNAVAGKYNSQGMVYLYGFAYDSARRSFLASAKLDPKQVFAHLGVALSRGNTINWSYSAEDGKVALEALQTAKANRANGSSVENDLVDASLIRFSEKGYSQELGQRYADQMRKIYEKYPNDPDVGALFAESLMNLSPWKQWTLKGEPERGTTEALAVLRHVLDLNQNHPQALHLWIHGVEGSKTPQMGLAEAYRLLNLLPDISHLQHMPSHIFDRAGRYEDSIRSNLKAIARVKKEYGDLGRGSYLDETHGRHMIVHAACMTGRFELAMQHLSQMFDGIPADKLAELGSGADFYTGMKYMVLVRFGKWDRIMSEPAPPVKFRNATIERLAAIAIAQAAKGDVVKARQSLTEAGKLVRDDAGKRSPGEQTHLEQRLAMAEGEVLFYEKKELESIASLQKAVELEDKFAYTEPPDFMIPARHPLGAALIELGRFNEALEVYRQDLLRNPGNGWALYGMHRAYTGLNNKREADRAFADYRKAWIDADMETTSSCLCMPRTKKAP